ncbi:hypothetical protein GIY23_18870 [Allosaccharopolyspora coralli]|uniref:PPE domain-containing protein n=1 Tax=Allosaccharopolyspora coralli TaxID=2665642 RepID=A0A5Q3QIM3_9PSEU|nr:hypothetical protein [Allosaccharopolyspora coralli]QGK71309.1 hypothetical protein GIY23_18870 [Allosaccharopolyspora coralli]
MSNPLVADVQPSVMPEDGIAVIDFGTDTLRAVESGDWCEAGINAAATGLDALSVVADPFGTLLSSAFAWAMEHVDPLPEMLDSLAGNPDAVNANAETWANVSQALGDAAADMEQAVASDTAAWHGPAIDAYKIVGAGEAMMIKGASGTATAVGAAVAGAAAAVAAVRTTVRDLIAEAMSDLVQWLARSAIAAGLTLGMATPVLVADAIRIVAKWSSRVADWLERIVTSIKRLADIVKRVKPMLDKVKDTLEPLQKAAQNVPASSLTAGQQLARNATVSGAQIDDKPYAQTTGEQ